MEKISFSEWEKIDLRVAEIKKVEEIEGADKLYKLKIDIGNEERIIVAGIKQHYSKEELIGKKIVVLTNLEPKKLKGVESKGMLLAAVGKEVVLITPEKDVEAGTKIS